MKVLPVPGRLIRDPATGREFTTPLIVPDGDPFWLRRLAAGDAAPEAEEKPDDAKGGKK